MADPARRPVHHQPRRGARQPRPADSEDQERIGDRPAHDHHVLRRGPVGRRSGRAEGAERAAAARRASRRRASAQDRDDDQRRAAGQHIGRRAERHVRVDIGVEHLPERDMAHQRIPAGLDQRGQRRRERDARERGDPRRDLRFTADAEQHQDEEEPGHDHGLGHVGLRLDHEVQEREDADPVDQRMQGPPFRPEPSDHGVGRGGGERREAEPRDEADRQIEAQRDLARHVGEVEMLVDDVERQVGRRVGEGGDPDHAPDRDQLRIARRADQRRHQQRQQQEPDRPEARPMDHFGDHLGLERAGRGEIDDPGRGANRPANTTAFSGEKRPLRSFQGAFRGIMAKTLSWIGPGFKPRWLYGPAPAFVSVGPFRALALAPGSAGLYSAPAADRGVGRLRGRKRGPSWTSSSAQRRWYCRRPSEWRRIEPESGDAGYLFANYAAYLAAIPPICEFLRRGVFGWGGRRSTISTTAASSPACSAGSSTIS